MKLLLEGKNCIVTGANSGIGYATAELFVNEGANVMLIARRAQALQDAADQFNAEGPGKAVWLAGDVTDAAFVKNVFEKTEEVFGSVDVLVNSAGIANSFTIENTEIDVWDSVMDINAKGTFVFSKEAVPRMLEKNSGSIINVSSCAGLRPLSGTAYSASKGAVNALTYNIAFRLGGSGVRCNCICPGRVATALQNKVKEQNVEQAEKSANMHDFGDKYVRRDIPALEATGQAKVALFLASDLAADVNGVVIPVDAGQYMPC